MRVLDTFSKRQKKLTGLEVDVFTYDDIPKPLRIQICHIWMHCFGVEERNYLGSNPIYARLHQALAAEFGLFALGDLRLGNAAAIRSFFVDHATTEQAIDMIDVSFRFVIAADQDWNWSGSWQQELSSDKAIEDLNARFLEHGIGYTFAGGDSPQLIRMDNVHLHKEAVVPALRLLHEEGFLGANAEYRKAHEHYRAGAHKECLNECLKAFESTMKTICTKRKWTYKETDAASSLIDTCLKNGLLPTFMQTHLGTIKSALESAIPTVRNKLGGHGQGVQPKDVPQYYAEYLLHETATTIVFLVDAYKVLG